MLFCNACAEATIGFCCPLMGGRVMHNGAVALVGREGGVVVTYRRGACLQIIPMCLLPATFFCFGPKQGGRGVIPHHLQE